MGTFCFRGFSLFLLFILAANPLFSQNFIGKITDSKSIPIAGSTVLIREINQGLVCDDAGSFQTKLKPGTYSVEYRSIGYESKTETITIKDQEIVKRDIILDEKDFDLKEVTVTNKKDPAYEIMQNAIDKAPYHQNLVKEYNAETYIKGNIELVNISKLMDKLSSSDGIKMSNYKGNMFVQESYNNIKFTAPDKYEQTVKAFSSSAPDDFEPANSMRLASSSLYLPRFSGLISPLNEKAFNCYNFRYEGYFEDNNQFINIISVIPKMKDPELLEGKIYIADQSWDIRYADLTSNMYGIEQHFTITYDQMKGNVYLPSTFSNKMKGSILGIEGYFNYYASIKYNQIVLNDSTESVVHEKKKIKSLEIKRDETYSVITDSLATKRDSTYWLDIRNIPLNNREKVSFVKKDSIQHGIDSLRKKRTDAKFSPLDIITGGQIGGDSAKYTFKYGGIFGGLRNYNFVDGFGLGQKFELSTKIENKNRLSFSPEIYYTTARKAIAWNAKLNLDYAPMRLGNIAIYAGDVSSDFNPIGVNLLDNAINSLLWGKNARMLYRNKFISAANHIDIANGLRLGVQLNAAKRSILENNITYSFFGSKKDVKENMQDPTYSDLYSYNLRLEYTPEYYYTVSDGRKKYRKSRFPTFSLGYKEGVSFIKSNSSRFRSIDLGVRQYIQTGVFSSIMYNVEGGTFIGNRNRMNFADYKHFSTVGDLWQISKSPLSSFMLLDPYQASTNRYWVAAQANYYSKYILLKRLPFLQGKMFNEALHLKYLYTPNKRNYSELGYSVDLFTSLSLGVHCSFDNFKYDSFGIRLSYSFDIFK